MKRLLGLSDVKEAVSKGTISFEEAAFALKTEDIQGFIKDVLDNFDNGDVKFDEMRLSIISTIIDIAWYVYTYSGIDTGITDTEYDKLYDILGINGKSQLVSLPLIMSDTKEVSYHSYPVLRGTLSKIHYLKQPVEKENKSRKSLDSWIEKMTMLYHKKSGKRINMKDLDVYVFPKWDGVSVVFEFNKDGSINKALTRGYTKFNTAEDVTHHFKGLVRPHRRLEGGSFDPVNYGLKTEIMVEEETVAEYNMLYSKDYKQSRAIASGIINSDKPDKRNDYLVIMQLRYVEEGSELEELCPEVFDHPFIRTKLGNYDAIEEFAQNHRLADGLRCDGAVIYIIDKEVRRILGRENDRNNYEVAYKFTEEYDYSTVTDIVFQVGLLGRITPVVKIKPIKLKGNTITSASLSNMERLEELHLAKGDKVKILYDIIPYATMDVDCEMERSGNEPIKPKEKCPSCGKQLTRNGAFLMCTNSECDCRKKGKILNYITKLRIMDISYATVDTLYDLGILTSIKDLYKLKNYKDIIADVNGFGEATFTNWIYQIDDKRKVSDSLFLGALGIDGIAEKVFDLVLQKYDLDELLEIADNKDTDSLVSIFGIGEKKAKKIIDGLKENKSLIKSLRKELEIYHEDRSGYKFSVCFTKIRDIELEKYIIDMGGKVVDNMRTDVTYLVVPNLDTSSSKVKYAKLHGIEIVPIDKLRSKIKTSYGRGL